MNGSRATDAPVPPPLETGADTRRVLVVALAGNLAIAVSKFGAAALTGSSAMLAEGVHSLVDTGNELLLMHGLRRGRRAVDDAHPFGYGKATYVWSLLVALLVFAVGGGVSVYEGLVSLIGPAVPVEPAWNLGVLAVAAGFEGWSWRVALQALDRERRPGEGHWHALQRSPNVLVFTVFVEDTAALAGIAIAALGVGLGHAFDQPWLDPAASVLIGGVLIGAAGVLAHKSLGLLVGESIDPEQTARLRRVISADPSVESVGTLMTMQLGPDSVLLTAAVRFRRALDLDQVEQAIARLEAAIRAQVPSVHHLYLESGALKENARPDGRPAPG